MAGGTRTWETSRPKLVMPSLPRLIHRHGVGRCGGLEADPEEHHLTARVLLRDLQSVERRVDDPYVAALAADPEQVTAGPGNPEHVTERAEDHVRAGSDLQRLVDDFQRGDADGTPRAVDQFDLLRQELVDSVPDDGVCLSAADLHERPRPGDDGVDVVEQ